MKREEEKRAKTMEAADPEERRADELLSDEELLAQIKSWRRDTLETGGIVSVKETAARYYPDYHPESASRALRFSIRSYPLLERALGLVGWGTRKRSFTPLQLLVLTHYLGRP